MPKQTPHYLSVKEAIETTGVSDATIRRLCQKGIKGTDFTYDEDKKLLVLDTFLYSHYKEISVPKQDTFLPRQEDNLLKQEVVLPMQDNGLPKQVPMHEDILLKQIQDLPKQNIEMPKQAEPVPRQDELSKEYYQNLIAAKEATIQIVTQQLQSKENQLTVKDQQLQAKDEQLQTKDQQINQLIERNRESNIIIQSLQEKFTKQLQAPQQTQSTKQANIPVIDKVLTGVAIVSAVALLIFILLMVFAYFNR